MVGIQEPQFCNNNFPQAFCSTFDEQLKGLCQAPQGSPVICGNNSIISGFVLNSQSCGRLNGRFSLEYHSTAEFQDWIEEVSNAKSLQSLRKIVMIGFVVFVKSVSSKFS